jgi:hypothetical protein
MSLGHNQLIEIELFTLGGNLIQKKIIEAYRINDIYEIIERLEYNYNKCYTLLWNENKIYSNFDSNIIQYDLHNNIQKLYTFNI